MGVSLKGAPTPTDRPVRDPDYTPAGGDLVRQTLDFRVEIPTGERIERWANAAATDLSFFSDAWNDALKRAGEDTRMRVTRVTRMQTSPGRRFEVLGATAFSFRFKVEGEVIGGTPVLAALGVFLLKGIIAVLLAVGSVYLGAKVLEVSAGPVEALGKAVKDALEDVGEGAEGLAVGIALVGLVLLVFLGKG